MEDKNFNSNADGDASGSGNLPASPQKKNSSPKMLIILVLVIVIGGGAVWAVNYINQLKGELANSGGIKTEPNMFMSDEEAEEYVKDKVDSINVTMNTNVVCEKDENGVVMAHVGLENLNDFQYVVKFDLESGETIAQTGLVPAGREVDKVALTKPLEQGTYAVNAIFTAISSEDNQTSLGATGISVDFIVTGN